MQTRYVGVDAAKDFVVAACADETFEPRKIPNRRAPLKAWLETLPPGSRVAVESTGRYHVLLADLAYERGLTVYVLNPKAIRYYAKGMQIRGKTDRVDARVIARYLAKEHEQLHPYVPPTPQQRLLDQLVKRRACLVTTKVALKASTADLDFARTDVKGVLKKIDGLIAKLDAHREELIQTCPAKQASYRRFQQITGVGPVVGAGLLQALDRIPFRNADAFVAYTGLDPRPEDSGRKVGRRRLSKHGPSELRRLLYTAGMAAAKTKLWRTLYQRYRLAGLSTTAAIVVLARRIARIAWSMHRYQTDFKPDLIPA